MELPGLLRSAQLSAVDAGLFPQHLAPVCCTSPLCRFYRLSSELVRAVMLGLDENGVDFSFRCGARTCRLAVGGMFSV